MKSSVLKILAYIELILGVIGAFALGFAFKVEIISDDLKATEQFNFGLALTGIMAVVTLFIVLFALATILEKIELMEKRNSEETMWALTTILDKVKKLEK